MEEKKCSKCGGVKPLSEFYKDASRKTGFQFRCIKCEKQYREDKTEYYSKYWKESYKKKKEYYREYQAQNREHYNKHAKVYRAIHKEKCLGYQKKKIKNIADNYCVLLLQHQGVHRSYISPEMIELKRAIITAKRELKNNKE